MAEAIGARCPVPVDLYRVAEGVKVAGATIISRRGGVGPVRALSRRASRRPNGRPAANWGSMERVEFLRIIRVQMTASSGGTAVVGGSVPTITGSKAVTMCAGYLELCRARGRAAG